MKPLIWGFILSLAFTALPAAPVGNPSAANMIQEGLFIPQDSWIDIRADYEGSFVTDRRLKQRADNMRRIDHYAIDTNAAKCTVNFVNRCDIFAVLGEARICADWRVENSFGTLSYIESETKYNFAWAAGLDAILLQWNKTELTFGGRYFYTHPRMLWLTKNGAAYSIDDARMKFAEWQCSLAISHQIDIFVPYIGIKYSYAHSVLATVGTTISDNDTSHLRMKSRNRLGMVIGYATTTGKWYAVDLEARFFDEAALTIYGGFRF
jgi:hypothetical protein